MASKAGLGFAVGEIPFVLVELQLDKVDAWSDGSGTLKVEVHYKIRSTLSEQQVSLEFSGK